MVRHGRIGQVKGDGANLQTGSWVALGPVFTEHLVPNIPALPTLFVTGRPHQGEAYLAHHLLSGQGLPDDATLEQMGGFVHQGHIKSLFHDLQKGNMALAADYYYPHLLRHDLSLCLVGSSKIRIEDETKRGRVPPPIDGEIVDWGPFLCGFGDCTDLPDHLILLGTFR
eukprot:218244-Heterocapsa_arctica.AAC.1